MWCSAVWYKFTDDREAVISSDTSVSYQTTRRNIPESGKRIFRREYDTEYWVGNVYDLKLSRQTNVVRQSNVIPALN
jgi:hypothetical protein